MEELLLMLNKFCQSIRRLESNANELSGNSQARFEELVSAMREKMGRARSYLQTVDRTDENARNRIEAQFNQLETEMRHLFAKATKMAGDSLGWPEGLAKLREKSSEGWVEGVGERSEASNGWVEGMSGTPDHDSRGWVEGMEEKKSA